MRMLSAAILLHIPPERSNSPFYQNLDVTFGLRDKIFFLQETDVLSTDRFALRPSLHVLRRRVPCCVPFSPGAVDPFPDRMA